MTEFEGVRVVDVLYRVSTRAQEKEGESLFNQERTVEQEWAVPRGIQVRHRVRVAESGKSALRLRGGAFEFSRRLEYRDLIIGYQNGGALPDAVCVDWSDRWSRNLLEFIVLIETFRSLGIRLLAIGEGIDLTRQDSKAFTAIKAVFAEEQVRVTSDKVRENRRSRRERARWQGGRTPDGYRTHQPECPGLAAINRTGPDGVTRTFRVRSCSCPPDVLYRDPDREATLHAVWDLLARSPLSWAALAEDLNQAGHRRRNGERFRWNELYRMAENPHYAGIMTTDRWERGSGSQRAFVRHRPLREQGLRPADGAIVDPYISEDEFWRIYEARLSGHRRHLQRSKRGSVNELVGILVCPCCSTPMSSLYSLSSKKCGSGAPRRAARKRYVFVCCRRGGATPPTCAFGRRRVRVDRISAQLITALAGVVAMTDSAIIEALRLQKPSRSRKSLQREHANLEKSIQESDTTRRFLQRERAVGRITDEEYQRDLFEFRRSTQEAKRRLDDIAAVLSTTHALPSFSLVRQTVSWLTDKWAELTVPERAETLRLLVAKVTLGIGDRVKVLEYGPGFVDRATDMRLRATL